MVRAMNLKKSIKGFSLKKLNNKKGVYILEAAVVIPIFVLVMVALISIIPVIGAAENALFAIGDELRKADIRAAFIEEPVSLPLMVESRVTGENRIVDNVYITDLKYLESGPYMDDLIGVKVRLKYSKRSIFGALGLLKVEQGGLSRAFTGKDRRGETGLGEDEEYDPVYIFPNRGVRYHNKSCPFLNPACQKVVLTYGIRSKFQPCSHCKSDGAELGSQVFCFFTDGKVYHLGNCNDVDKYYVEMNRREAISKGYTPCGSCGG